MALTDSFKDGTAAQPPALPAAQRPRLRRLVLLGLGALDLHELPLQHMLVRAAVGEDRLQGLAPLKSDEPEPAAPLRLLRPGRKTDRPQRKKREE